MVGNVYRGTERQPRHSSGLRVMENMVNRLSDASEVGLTRRRWRRDGSRKSNVCGWGVKREARITTIDRTMIIPKQDQDLKPDEAV
nr:hypothetical protein CFP56_03947 [Quercus suber]